MQIKWLKLLASLHMNASRRNSGLLLKEKADYWWWYVLAVLHQIITLKQGKWLVTNYYSVIGNVLYVPSIKEFVSMSAKNKFALFSHEYQHRDDLIYETDGWEIRENQSTSKIKESTFYTNLKFCVLYLVSWKFRRYIEKRGFQRTLEVSALYHNGDIPESTKDWVVDQLSGPNYAWLMSKDDARTWVNTVATNLSIWAKTLPREITTIPKQLDFIDEG